MEDLEKQEKDASAIGDAGNGYVAMATEQTEIKQSSTRACCSL